MTYLTLSAVDAGLNATLSFYLLAILNATSTLGRVSSGVLADRYGTSKLSREPHYVIPYSCRTSQRPHPGKPGHRGGDIRLAVREDCSRVRRDRSARRVSV